MEHLSVPEKHITRLKMNGDSTGHPASWMYAGLRLLIVQAPKMGSRYQLMKTVSGFQRRLEWATPQSIRIKSQLFVGLDVRPPSITMPTEFD
jgi:hypothetical protein